MKAELTNIERATLAWGSPLPEFVRVLADYSDLHNQRLAGEKIRRSSGTVSKILNNKYPASAGETEILVMAGFNSNTVDCPLHGHILLASCVRQRRRKGPAINTLQRQFAAACPVCPLNPERSQRYNQEKSHET